MDASGLAAPASGVDKSTFFNVFPLPGLLAERVFYLFDTAKTVRGGRGSSIMMDAQAVQLPAPLSVPNGLVHVVARCVCAGRAVVG